MNCSVRDNIILVVIIVDQARPRAGITPLHPRLDINYSLLVGTVFRRNSVKELSAKKLWDTLADILSLMP